MLSMLRLKVIFLLKTKLGPIFLQDLPTHCLRFWVLSTKDGRSMTTFYYCSVNHKSGLQQTNFQNNHTLSSPINKHACLLFSRKKPILLAFIWGHLIGKQHYLCFLSCRKNSSLLVYSNLLVYSSLPVYFRAETTRL